MEHFWVRIMQEGNPDVCLNSAGPYPKRIADIVAHQTEVKLPETGGFYVKVVNPSEE